MTQTLLVATDFSDESASALRMAASLARADGDALTVVHVIEELDEGSAWLILVETPEEIEQNLRKSRMDRLRTFCQRHIEGVLPDDRLHLRVEVGGPTDELLAIADEIDPAMIVAGSVGRGMVMSAIMGSTANQLVRQSEWPVLLVPESETPRQIRTVLAPVDGSAASRASLMRAAALAEAVTGKLIVLNAMGAPTGIGDPSFPVYLGQQALEGLRAQRRKALTRVLENMGVLDLVEEVIVNQSTPAMEIKEVAERYEVDLICMGSHGRRGIKRFLLGNTAEKVLRSARCPVLVLREEADAPLFEDLSDEEE